MTRGLASLCLAAGALAVLPASAFACSGAGAPPGAVSAHAYERSVECLVDARRAGVGLAPLAHDGHLAHAASRFSRAMVRQRFFAHVSPRGSTPDARARSAGYSGATLGETIAWGSGALGTPAAIVEGWMNSPPHRAILLSGAFRRIGVGVTRGSPAGIPGATVTADLGG